MMPDEYPVPTFLQKGPKEWVGTGEFKDKPMRPGPIVWVDAPAVDDSSLRKTAPVATGCVDYFPDALWAVAELSFYGNEKHNPGEPVHDARGKSQDDADCLMRHFTQRGTWDTYALPGGRTVRIRHSAAVAWRALRILQKECEADGAPLPRGARVTITEET
jgi:hypothetical protein